MSAYGGPQTADLERQERMVDSEAGWADGDGWDDQPTEKCTRQAPPMVPNQARRGPCPGRIVPETNRCDWCGKPPRGTK